MKKFETFVVMLLSFEYRSIINDSSCVIKINYSEQEYNVYIMLSITIFLHKCHNFVTIYYFFEHRIDY